MNILGINPGHDASAAILVNGRLLAAAAEERFTRIKHYSGLPPHSIQYCLDAAGLAMADIDVIALPSRHDIFELNYLLDIDDARRPQKGIKHINRNYLQRSLGLTTTAPPLNLTTFPVSARTEFVQVEHHLAHAASAYYTSGTAEKQLIVTMDGAGDGVSSALWLGEAGRIEPLLSLPVSSSLGWFYSNVTEALGWRHGSGEGKTMGLAPYGDAQRCRGVLDGFYPRFADGNVTRPHDFGRGSYWNEYGDVQYHFEDATRIRALVAEHGREHIAAEAQRVLEAETAQLILPWLDRLGTRRLSCSGGVFLNVKLNQRLWENGRLQQQWIFPDAGDSGLALGAALWAHYQAHPDDPILPLEDAYLGPSYDNAQIEAILQARNLAYTTVDDPAAEVAGRLARQQIVAWFQGRMECGPRALGNRSILMSAARAENKDIINERVKFREPFRPFCPTLPWEAREDYFDNGRDEAYMITSFDVREEKRSRIPAVVHVDGTARPQMVRREGHPALWHMLQQFGELTGEPLVLNTSFNIRGEPIACHPRDAIRCFYDNGLDALVMGNYVLAKRV